MYDSDISSFTCGALITTTTLLLFYLIIKVLLRVPSETETQQGKLWKQLEIIGLPSKGLFPMARGLLASLPSLKRNVEEGYNKISKAKNLPFAVPNMWTGNPVVVLPPSLLHLVNTVPESELTGFWALMENVQLPYFIPDRDVLLNVIHFEVSRKDLTERNVSRQAAPTADEVDVCFRELWGVDTEQWRVINGWDMCGGIVARVALRTLVGSPMCRDRTLLEQTRKFADALFGAAAIINCTPPFLRPFLGPLLALPAAIYRARCQRILEPLVRERIRLWEEHDKLGKGELPSDFLQWLIPRCAGHGPEHLDPTKIAMRIIALNTMFVFAMSYVFAHTVIDLCASPDKDEFLRGLDEECRAVMTEYHPEGLASKEAVDRLYRADSAIRESMRVSGVGILGLPRDVVGKKPLDLGNGILVPPGTRIVFATQPMHMDPDYHRDPLRFDAFRFSRPFEQTGSQAAEGNEEDNKKAQSRELISTCTPGFLPFGYGKRACPGRWFVAQTLKQALGYLVMNYDIELVGEPPRRKALLNMMIPPTGAKLRIRRRSE